MESTNGTDTSFEPKVIDLPRDEMIDHPAGAHYVLWNGPACLDVGVPAGGFVRFAVASFTEQWTQLVDGQMQPLPVAVRAAGPGLQIWWLPYDGPGARAAEPTPRESGMTDADYAAALQNISTMRYQSMMDAARAIGGWTTRRR